jgi:formylglycine-generating enzyme required for sulfatase activity
MVPVGEAFCVDQYEASRPDATAQSAGADSSQATSREGVLPWVPVEYATAKSACEAAGKRLCTESELQGACSGPDETTYPYGNNYDPTTCNGVDTYCRCDSANCADLAICPYPHCYNESPEGTVGLGCGADLRVMPTGSFSSCVNEYGAFDLSGNVWELVERGDETSWYVGGAYNCLDSEALHQCDSLEQNVSARGFRCCADYGTGTPP